MPVSTLTFEDQVAQLIQLLKVLPPTHATQKALLELLVLSAAIPPQFFPTDFVDSVAKKFTTLNQTEVRKAFSFTVVPHVNGIAPSPSFEPLLPKSGWLADYMLYTEHTEPPTVFHFFAALTVLGATIARRMYFPRGNGDLFPNVNCVLVAPAGMCKKTTACNLAVSLFRRIGGNVLADKITAEAIIDSFKQASTATGLIYAPEWAVFLGKQQYMEGLVPMLTALFDCPSVWSSGTIMRGATQLQNVALSHLAATTIDWMQTSITKDAFSGGFMSRLLFIVQHDTPRSFPFPPPLDAKLAKKLVDGLMALQQIVGSVSVSPDAHKWYTDWYNARRASTVEKQLAGYFERKPDRLLQIAMILNAAENPRNLVLSEKTLQHAEGILNWIERLLPSAFSELSQTSAGDDQHRLLKQIRLQKGEIDHTTWLRLNKNRMDAHGFKKSIETLKQAGLVTVDPVKKRYYLLPAGWIQE